VAAVYLVHGTFAGNDALGLATELGRYLPSASETLRRWGKALFDAMAGDAGNFTESYARLFERGLNAGGGPRIPVRLFNWSSENHHLGRADAAVRLVDELAGANWEPNSRVLMWGHSHAGNVFALLTNLLAAGRRDLRKFFRAAKVYYRWPILQVVDEPHWPRVRKMLAKQVHPLKHVSIDLVTFGTPVRYGWDTGGYSRLLHFIHHRPAPGIEEWEAPFPPTVDQVQTARYGDYVQQLALAGTNLVPGPFSWRSAWADWQLGKLLEPGLGPKSLFSRLGVRRRVPFEGITLLVDYGLPKGGVKQHVFGHAVYTRAEWLLFHAETVARNFYGLETADSP
jgi:hypothetical protein